jgi:putative sigma-54 modulation protein
MQINLTGHHVDVTDSLRDYVNGKFEKLERHFDHINNVHVVLTVEKQKHKIVTCMHRLMH